MISIASKAGNLKRAPEQHVKQCAYCKSDHHQVHDCPRTADPRCFKCNSPDHKEKDCTHEAHTNLKRSAAEVNLSMRHQQSAAPDDPYKHQRFHQDWPPVPPHQQGPRNHELTQPLVP